jgi:hypothetical protein
MARALLSIKEPPSVRGRRRSRPKQSPISEVGIGSLRSQSQLLRRCHVRKVTSQKEDTRSHRTTVLLTAVRAGT